MINNQDQILLRITDSINKNNTASIVLPVNPSLDSVGAATALYLVLNQLNKTGSLACQTQAHFDLVASDKIQSKLVSGGNSLVISFPYTDGSIDKVDYNIEGESFNLVVTPRQGYQKLDPESVKYSYTGGTVNFIIIIDAPTLSSLGSIYNDNKSQFQGKEIINIDRHLTNANFGSINFVDKTSSSVSELVLEVIKGLNIEVDKDIATNLYAGIAAATNNFTSYSVNAQTFENAAFLLKKGALKKLLKKPAQNYFTQTHNPSVRQLNNKPIEAVEKEVDSEGKNPPTDWLKPKIFRGGGLI